MNLTSILHQAVKDSSLSVKEIAAHLGKPYHTLMSELSYQEGHKLGIEFLLPIMKITNNHKAMNYLARELGGTFIMVDMDSSKSDDVLTLSLISSVKEFGEFVGEFANHLADGIIDKGEIERINKEGQEALNAIMQLMQLAKEVHMEEYEDKTKKITKAVTSAIFTNSLKKESINEASI